MKILPVSDLHLEKWWADWRRVFTAIPSGVADVVVLAGDIVSVNYYAEAEVEAMFRGLAEKGSRAIFVPGNHEFFARTERSDGAVQITGGMSPPEVEDFLVEKLPSWGVDVLSPEGGPVEIGGVRFIGSTLWFPDAVMNVMHEKYVCDFSYIKAFKPWVYERNKEMRRYLKETVVAGDVVVTHHLPSARSIHSRFKNSMLNAFFMTEMDDLILEREPALWIHGHGHNGFDYTLGKTRVVANPLGYPEELAKGHTDYREGFVVEVGSGG